jgi:hypothetical protein
MHWIARNVFTVGTLTLALAAGLAAAAGVLPADAAAEYAKWSMVATAIGRALVVAAEQIYHGPQDFVPAEWTTEAEGDE